jgi:hypothetical protein
LYGCETWPLTLREEHILKVYQNIVLRRIFVLKKDKMIGGWRKLRNEKSHNLYSASNIIGIFKSRRVGWTGHVAHRGEEEYIQNFSGRPGGERPIRRLGRRWEDNIVMCLLS